MTYLSRTSTSITLDLLVGPYRSGRVLFSADIAIGGGDSVPAAGPHDIALTQDRDQPRDTHQGDV
jgi:hypothetical protein